MRLVTFNLDTPVGPVSRIGALVGEQVIDLGLATTLMLHDQGETGRAYEVSAAVVPPDMIEFLRGGPLSRRYAEEAVRHAAGKGGTVAGPRGERVFHRLSETRLLAPVPRPTSIRDTLSFEGHMKNFEKRTGRPVPPLWYERPAYYKGNPASVIGPEVEVQWPPYTEKLDYELEFGIYIGKMGRDIRVEDARSHIAGYTIFNDISARDTIKQEVSLFLGPGKAKDMDTGNIMGPCLVTPDEIDPDDLRMYARINGEVWSQGHSSDMYWSFEEIIAHISQSETLHPGDFIGSGTIWDGCGDELDRWIQPGDVVELEVEGIGILRNRIARRT